MAITPQKITAWSFSRWSTYNECPRRAKYKFIDKMKEPGSAAMDRGTEIHEKAEKYLKTGGRLPTELKLFASQFKDLRKLKALAEADFTFKSDWSPTVWNDWNGAWVRIKADAIIPPFSDDPTPHVRVIDFKTGGKLDDVGNVRDAMQYEPQLQLYGLAGLLTYPTAEHSTGELMFIDLGKTVELAEPFRRADEKKLVKLWEGRVKKMLADTKFKPNPGNACRWCHFRKANNGPCEF